jgi:hypothetical protein
MLPRNPYMTRCSSETSVNIRIARRYMLEDGSIRNYRCENLKFYI